jgi:iron complex transport system permease protein
MCAHNFFSKKRTKLLLFLEICKKKCTFVPEMSKNLCIFGFLGVFLVLLFGLDVCSGTIWLWPFGDLNPMEQQIVHAIRFPKALTAILAGAALSVSGLMMQTLFRNPLAGPYTLGISSGASLGVALLTMIGGVLSTFNFQLSTIGLPFAAVIGATLVLLLVLAVSKRVTSNVSLLIVGLMFGSIAGALVSLLQNFANPDALKLFIVWTLGSLSSVGWSDMQMLVPVLVAGTLFALLALKPLNGLLLGEDYARGLGIHVERTRLYIVLATVLLAGGVTAFCGPIAFIGVAVPHIARGIFGTSNHRITLPASALIGACLLLVCDLLCSLFIYPLPVSTVSALFGAPVIIWIILKNR